ncbi:MAG: Do family serine endopeptidase [Rhodospirillaceae bacterium]|nr:Do family serine endopeptidase [Rhodospirillaceae bacterium]
MIPSEDPHTSRSLRRLLGAGLMVAVLIGASPGFAQTEAPINSDIVPPAHHAGFADLVETLLPAVVNISSTQTIADVTGPEVPQFPPGSPFEDFFDDFMDRQAPAERRATSLGSGFIISADGNIVTNNHVVDGADEITVILQDDTELPATVVGVDPRTDLAVLHVDSAEPLPYVAFGDSDTMRVGDWVLAIGNPFGLGGSVTAGIISARARDIHAGPYDDFLQTDASINRGNSGGPMFNTAGEVIGINTAIFSPTGRSVGVGFAIPSSLAEPVVSQLIEFGRTRRGWLGVRIQSVTDEIAESLGMPEATGALISSITAGGPSDGSALQPGDVIVSFNGEPIETMRELPRAVADTPVGSTVDVEVWRQGELITVPIELGELEEAELAGLLDNSTPTVTPPAGQTGEIDELGLRLAELDDSLRSRFGLSSASEGVVITQVASGSAAEQGLAPGDVILEVNQQHVATPDDVSAQVDEALAAGRNSVLLMVDSSGQVSFVALDISALRAGN